MVLRKQSTAGLGRLRLEERPDPDPAAGEILVRVKACGVCRTDLHVVEGDLPPVRMPIIPGHQAVGIVERTGCGVTRFAPGDRAGIAWLRFTCGACSFCVSGRENLCAEGRFTGWHEDGGYSELAVVPEAYAYPIPRAFSDVDAAPLLCAGIIGYRALRRSAVPPGGRLGIFGFGSSAHVTHQVALHRGCEVYVFSRGEASRSLASAMGATWVGDTFDSAPEPLDGAIVFAPAGEVVLPALRAVGKGGTVVIAGIHMTDLPSMAYEPHIFHEKVLTSVTANTREDGRRLLEEAAAIPIRPRVTAYPLEDANRAMLDLKEGRIEGTAVLVTDEG